MTEMTKPDPSEVFPCDRCGIRCVYLPGPYAVWVMVEAEPDDDYFRAPFAGEMRYVDGQHKLHFCQPKPGAL